MTAKRGITIYETEVNIVVKSFCQSFVYILKTRTGMLFLNRNM